MVRLGGYRGVFHWVGGGEVWRAFFIGEAWTYFHFLLISLSLKSKLASTDRIGNVSLVPYPIYSTDIASIEPELPILNPFIGMDHLADPFHSPFSPLRLVSLIIRTGHQTLVPSPLPFLPNPPRKPKGRSSKEQITRIKRYPPPLTPYKPPRPTIPHPPPKKKKKKKKKKHLFHPPPTQT